jgi:hypothetical protein
MSIRRSGRGFYTGWFIIITLALFAAAYAVRSWGVSSEASAQTGAYDSEGRRNPFIPLVGEDGRLLRLSGSVPEASAASSIPDVSRPGMDLRVEGIAVDPNGGSFAVVNDEIVKQGDMVGECKVLVIAGDRVIFEKNGDRIEIIVHKEEGT